MSALLCPAFRAARLPTFLFIAPSISTWLPQSIFEGLTDGEIPLHLMFSGTVFYADSEDALQVAPISWEQEAKFKLPVRVWREMMDSYYPKQRLAESAPRRLRAPVPVQNSTRNPHLGAGARERAARGRDGERMSLAANLDRVEKIAEAVLYEGYMLYPYRASAVKNQQRWNFGVLCPRSVQRIAEWHRSLDDADGMPPRARLILAARCEDSLPADCQSLDRKTHASCA